MIKTHPSRTRLIYLLISMLLLWACVLLLPQLGIFLDGLRLIRTANPYLVLLAILSLFITYIFASLALDCIALKPLRFRSTLVVQLASGFASKLVPAGIGGFALNTRYLTKQRHSGVQAGSVMALNGLLGLIGHMLILAAGFTFASNSTRLGFTPDLPAAIWWFMVALVALAVVFVIGSQRIKMRILLTVKEMSRSARHMARRPMALAAGFGGALGVTGFFTLSLYLCARSLGLELHLLEVMLVYTACAVGTALVPTPGGVGGAEAALSAALIALSTDVPLAVSVAVLYRVVVYWLPILPGAVFFQLALRRNII